MMARHELRERRLVPRRGRSNEPPDRGPHHAHHAIEIRPGAGIDLVASDARACSTARLVPDRRP